MRQRTQQFAAQRRPDVTEAILVTLLGILIGCNLRALLRRPRIQVDPTVVAAAEAMIAQAKTVHAQQAMVGSGMIVSRTLAFSVRGVGNFEAEIVEVQTER